MFPFSDEMKQELESIPLSTDDDEWHWVREKSLEFDQFQCLPESARTSYGSLGLSGYRFHLYGCNPSDDGLTQCGKETGGYTMFMNRTSWVMWRGFKVAAPWQPFLALEEADENWFIRSGDGTLGCSRGFCQHCMMIPPPCGDALLTYTSLSLTSKVSHLKLKGQTLLDSNISNASFSTAGGLDTKSSACFC